jgi:hypothetical protein
MAVVPVVVNFNIFGSSSFGVDLMCIGIKSTVTSRQEWQQRSLGFLDAAELVFLDPDNGFKVKSASSKT